MKSPEILSEKAPDREPAAQEIISAYVRTLDTAQLKRDILKQQIEGRRMEQAVA